MADMNIKRWAFAWILILAGNFLMAQQNDSTFSKQWLTIDSLIGISNLPKSALIQVKDLYQMAEEKSDKLQQIKALLYRLALEKNISESDINTSITSLKNELNKTTEAGCRAILQVLIAKQYQEYFNLHRWQLYNRSKTNSIKKEDILNWSAEDFLNAITATYLTSLSEKEQLKKISISNYEEILVKGNSESLRPTLYDIIAQDALEYFESEEGRSSRPVNNYSIQQPEALGTWVEFSNATLTNNDTNALAFRAILLFQELIRFHEKDTTKDALIHIDIDRINWVYKNAYLLENKKQLKIRALSTLANQFESSSASAHALAQLALDKVESAETYQPYVDTTNRWDYVDAKKLIEEVEQKISKNNPVKSELENLRHTILRKNLSTESELVNIPDKPFRALVHYRNVDTVFIRILALPMEVTNNNVRDNVTTIHQLCNTKPIFEKQQWLPATEDFQEHSAEIKLDALPHGEYVLFTSSGKNFNKDSDILNYQSFQVSNISFIQNKTDFFVLNRETGKPIAKAIVNIYSRLSYSNNTDWNNAGKLQTDENGYFKFTGYNYNKSLRFTINNKKDQLRILGPTWIEAELNSNDESNVQAFERQNRRAFFFTDRSIYRTGQTVYFKSILTTLDRATKMSKLITQAKSTVYLRDANYSIIDSLSFVSNEYGSFHGKFILPEKILTGNFSLSLRGIEIGTAEFSVEAYKRPTYSTQFEKINQAYRLNDSIRVTGIAKAFAGNLITGAKVSYHIIRNTRPFYYYSGYRSYRNSAAQEIAHGILQTDANGQFTISFKALPDPTEDSASNPIFDFTIEATVTDPSGETRTAKKQISCGYQSLLLQINHPELLNASKEERVIVLAKNLNEEIQPVQVNIKIIELRGPNRLIKERFWKRPDQFVISQEAFLKDFPYDLYNNENEASTFPIIRTALETTIDTRNKKEWTIEKGKLKSGYYQITASAKDSMGNLVEYKNYLQVFDPMEGSIASGQMHLFYTNPQAMEPGETDTIFAGSMAKELFVIQHIQKPQNRDDYHFIDRKKGLTAFVYSATSSDRGGIHIEELFVFQNRVYTDRFTKRIPFTNKALEISYSSFRNKTEPGSEEKWTIEISGKKGEKTAAELLTAMYDASLDEFKPHEWNKPDWWNELYKSDQWNYHYNLGNHSSTQYYSNQIFNSSGEIDKDISYDRLPANFADLWRISIGNHIKREEKLFIQSSNSAILNYDPLSRLYSNKLLDEVVIVGASPNMHIRGLRKDAPLQSVLQGKVAGVEIKSTEINSSEPTGTIIRKNFNETAFFFPQLYADSSGVYRFSFSMPDAVTKWKWMSFAHTKDLASGMQTAEIQTQKTLMVQSNAPRFMREGDKMEFSTRIVNLSDKELTGQITLELIDATTNTSVDGWFQNIFPTQYFTVASKQSNAVKFPIQIPFSFNRPLIWRVVARSGNYSDGEENVLAVLSNRQLVTESLPLLVIGDTTQEFHFNKLMQQNSSSATNESMTVEFSSNPIWYAIQALPYLKQGNDNCAEMIFNRIYANTIAAYIIHKNPIIKTWFSEAVKDSASLLSNLQKNQPLKQVLLEETPWVLAANTEAERKKNLADLFDLMKLAESNQSALEKLQELQLPNGAFSWFKGGYEDHYMTTHILIGIGRLKRLGAITPDMAIRFKPMLLKALQYADGKINEDYKWLIANKIDLNQKNISSIEIQYLYMRSFFADIVNNAETASNYYLKQSKQYWNSYSTYLQSLIGLVQLRNKEEKFVSNTLLPSIFENAVTDQQKGMYWKQSNQWYWQESPVETASMVIELASEFNQQNNSIERTKTMDAIKTWLILNKQTNNWKTSISTANACYALLLNGTDWLNQQKTVQIALGKMLINSNSEKTEAGTGYFEQRIVGSKVEPEMGNIKITTKTIHTEAQKNNQPAWGAVYWQYFEDLDKITEAVSPLSIQKKMMIEKTTDRGKELIAVDGNNPLKIGDKLIVRIVIKTDRAMEYIHLKDMRAAAMESLNVLSGYKWQDGMGYYESTSDISSNFFISHLNKGVHVFEYPVFVTHSGSFSAGIASIQCLYSPEFSSHSEGIKINVDAE